MLQVVDTAVHRVPWAALDTVELQEPLAASGTLEAALAVELST